MLRRLMSWCVPDTALELRVDESEEVPADLRTALAPYEHEATPAETRFNLRIVNNS
jgi:hypothetical protein